MKKLFGLLLVLLLTLLLAACGNGESTQEFSLPEGLNFLYNENGDYIQLGMTRTEVEDIFGEIDAFVIYSDYGMLRVFFENDVGDLHSIDTMFFGCRWIFPGGIRTGSDPSELENVFDMDYAHIRNFDDFEVIEFRFADDHTFHHPDSIDNWFGTAYHVEFTIYAGAIDTISLRWLS